MGPRCTAVSTKSAVLGWAAGRGTLCNACGVKMYRQQCKDRTQREKGVPGAPGLGAWGSGMIPEDLLAVRKREDRERIRQRAHPWDTCAVGVGGLKGSTVA